MGLFSKKTVVCEVCGKEYQVRLEFGKHVCTECTSRILKKERLVEGYSDYARHMYMDRYSEEKLDQIAEHRAAILEKYRMTEGISRAELLRASENYKKLTDEEAANVLIRMANSSINCTAGAAYSGYFFVLTGYEQVIVDADDVFAVGYTRDTNHQADRKEVLLCAVFTNDPYIPVFPMIYVGNLGFFEMMKSKKGRAGITALFESTCSNLTYPVQDLKNLKKQIKSEGKVNGNLDQKFMLDKISSALSNTGIFNTNDIKTCLDDSSTAMLDAYGYILDDQANAILKMDDKAHRKYWQKQIKRLADYDIGEE